MGQWGKRMNENVNEGRGIEEAEVKFMQRSAAERLHASMTLL
jgi:hypothetical protein